MMITADEKYILNELNQKNRGVLLHALLKTKHAIAEEHLLLIINGLIRKIKTMSNREYNDYVKMFPLQVEESSY